VKAKRKPPRVIYNGKKPSEVVLDIDRYARLLEQAEDWEDLNYLAKLRSRPPDVQPLEDYLAARKRR
jgi:hypothetical protein